MKSIAGFQVEKVPKSRKLIIENCEFALEKHRMLGLFEADVTESLSFTGWIAACLGKAVDEHKQVHALMIGNKFIVFDDVNINILVETVIEGRAYPINYVLKSVNNKSVVDITNEINEAKKLREEGVTEAKENRSIKMLLSAPKFLRKLLFWRKVRRDPHFIHERMGTVALTSIGMFARSGGWAIPLGLHAVSVAVGGITERPGFVGEKIEKREFLSLTVTLDHDVVDGAPATRFVSRFVELLESAYSIPSEF